MVFFDYFDGFQAGIEFLIALGSIIGLLGLVMGIIFLIWGGSRLRYKMLGVVLVSIVLLVICGFNTGLQYFNIYR
ncbi:MAG: hypothetical protein ACFE8M_09810 [Candidatus Hermodarchaeota archaeon]